MIMLIMILVIFTKGIMRDINLNEIVLDNIQQFDYRIYRLSVRNIDDLKHQQLVFSIFTQQNNLKVYIDCDMQPKFLDSYQWQSTSSQLILSYQQRTFQNCSDILFYIAVFSESISNYELLAQVLDGIHFVEYNLPIIGELQPEEIYQFKIQPTYLYEEITIEINIEQAQRYLKLCTQEDCLITKLDYQNTIKGVHFAKDTYTFFNSDCQNCYYLLGLLSDYKQFFRIITFNKNSHIKLKEGQFDQFQVEQGSSIYYIYNTSDLTNIKQIKFQLHQITGHCKLYGSSQNKNPSQLNYESETEYQITIDKNREYYLSVYGVSSCKYNIHTKVEREQTINQTLFNQLTNGISLLHQQNELFSFFIIQLEIKTNFSIKLQSNIGNFIMYVKTNKSDNEIPDSNSFEWKNSKQIDINIDESNQATIYYISVQCLNYEGEFVIEYKLNNNIKFYEVGKVIVDSVRENQVNYYRLPMLDRDILFKKEIYTENQKNNLIICISLNQTNIFPNQQYKDYIFLDSNLTIQQQELTCHHCQYLIKTQCFIYLSVTSISGVIFYTINTQYLNNKILLHEGCPMTFTFQQDMLFYYILSEKEVTIQWYSYGGSQAELKGYLGYLNNSNISYEQFKPQYLNTDRPIQTIIIPENKQDYTLYIQVQPFFKHFENDMYLIGVYENVKILTKSDKITDHVGKGQINYYILTVDDDTKSISFNVQVMGSYDSIILLLEQGKNSRPNIVIDSIQQSLRIDSFYIFRATIQQFFEQDQYVLGIQGEVDCEFQLSYQLINVQYMYFPNGYLPQEIQLHNIPIVYVYNETLPFKIILAVFSGEMQIKAKCFHNQINSLDFTDSFILDDISQEFKLYQFDACQYELCNYLIQIHKLEYTAQGVIQIQTYQQEIELFDNSPQYEVMKQNEIIEYIYRSQQMFVIRFNHVFGQVQVFVIEQNNNQSQHQQIINNNTVIDYARTTQTYESFMIKIECLTTNASFQILIIRRPQKISSLHLSQMLNIQMPKSEQYLFRYQSLASSLDENNNSNKLLTLQIQTIYSPINLFDIQISHSSINPIINFEIHFRRGIYYKLYNAFGRYDIAITPKINSSYITILLSDENINTLMNGLPQYQITKVGQSNFYQIVLVQNSSVLLEVLACRGTVLIQGTSNPSNLNKQIFEIQIMSKPQQYFNTILQLDEGIYYFLVKLISSQVKDENQNRISNYYIRQQIFRITVPIQYSTFRFRNVSLNWNIIQNEVIIEIPNLIQDHQFLIQQQIKIYYIVQILQKDEFVCFYESFSFDSKNDTQFIKIVQASSQENITKVKFQITDSSTIYLNIIGKVEILEGFELQELTYPFPITELNLENRQTKEEDIQILYYLILFLILLLVFFISRQCYKKRKIKVKSQNSEKLNIEMNYQTFNVK